MLAIASNKLMEWGKKLVQNESPLALVIGVFIIGVSVFGYIDRWTKLPAKVDANEQKIQNVRKTNERQSEKIESIVDNLEDISENQKIQICSDPDIGPRWRAKVKCEDL